MISDVRIVRKPDLPRLERLWRDIAAEEAPGDVEADGPAARGFARSLGGFDLLDSDSFWIFAVEVADRYVGYAAVARIPKADDRVGFLYIDELHVLSACRRQGHATRLLEAAAGHAAALGMAGIRLLVDPANEAGRRLYRKLGFAERSVLLCQR